MKKKNTFLLTLVGTFGAIVCTVVYALLLSLLANVIFSQRFGDACAVALLPNQMTYIVLAFAVFEIVFFVWLFSTLAKEKSDRQDGIISSDKKPRLNIFTKVGILCGALILVFVSVLSVTAYTSVSEDGVTRKNLFVSDKYTWDDVYKYELLCDESANISFVLQFTDGTTTELFTSTNSCSDKFSVKYGDMLSFAGYISDTLDSQDRIVGKSISDASIKNLEKFFKSSSPATWEKIQKIIE